MLPDPSGQFYHGIQYEVSDLHQGEAPEKPDATMFVKGQTLNVTRYTKRNIKTLTSEHLQLYAFEQFQFLSTEAGRETSGGMWRTEKTYPAGSFTTMEQV